MPQQGFVSFRDLDAAAMPPAASRDMIPPSTEEGDPGYFEDRGIAGAEWHAPTGSGGDVTRPDNSLLGMPPELVVAPALGVGGAVLNATVQGTSRARAGAQALAATAAPAAKYEITKSALEMIGVPTSMATAAAVMVSGYRRGTAPKAPSAGSASRAGSSPATPTSPAAPVAAESAATSRAASTLSPQRIRNEVGVAARRAKVQLSERDLEVADDMVRQGVSPAEAVKTVAEKVAQPPATSMGRLRLNAAEAKEYARLRGLGKTHAEAAESVVTQRALAAKLGTPSSKQVQSQVAERNATGRWPTDQR